jgi:hypothetical protein
MNLLKVTGKFYPRYKKWLFALLVITITVIGVGLRVYAANNLPLDSDERTYMRAALQYNDYIRNGPINLIAHYGFNFEHPPFYKILYGVALLTQPPLYNFKDDQTLDNNFVLNRSIAKVPGKDLGLADRYVSVISGGLTILAISIFNPLAGLFFATDTLAVKYDSTMFLEALPVLTNLLAAFCYLQWYQKFRQKSAGNKFIWLGLSAAFMGVSLASKYSYVIMGIVIAIHFTGSILLKKLPAKTFWTLGAWGLLVLAAFFVCDPYIWKHAGELFGSIYFHLLHTQSDQVVVSDLPFYQPFIWLSAPAGAFKPDTAGVYLIAIDSLIGLLALVGLPRLYRRQPFYFIWLITGMAMLLLWQTKWQQYTMIIMVPLCLSAAMGTGWLYTLLKNGLVSWRNQVTGISQ